MTKKVTLKLILVICLFSFTISSQNTTGLLNQSLFQITIDGDFSDWTNQHINPAIVDDPVNESYPLDLQKGYLVANNTHLFIQVEFDRPYSAFIDPGINEPIGFHSLFSNITIQNPLGDCYIVMTQVVYKDFPELSGFTAVFKGISLDSPYNNITETSYSHHSGTKWTMVNYPVNTTLEFAVLLTDLDMTYNSIINATFWHFDQSPAGSLAMFQPVKAKTIINYKINSNEPINSTDATSITTNPTGIIPVILPDNIVIIAIGLAGTVIAVAIISQSEKLRK